MAAETLSMSKTLEIIDNKKFAAAVLNADNKTFVVYIVALVELKFMSIYFLSQVQVALQTSEKSGISTKYSNFFNVFSSDSVAELPEYTGINYYSIDLLDNEQLRYSQIYSLGQVEIEMLKTYIEANLASSFIRSSKSFVGTLILFVKKMLVASAFV